MSRASFHLCRGMRAAHLRSLQSVQRHPVVRALNAGPLPRAALRDLELRIAVALDDLDACRASVAQIGDLHDLVDIGARLARAGIGAEALEDLQGAHERVAAALDSDAPADAARRLLPELRVTFDVLAEQRRLCTRAEWVASMLETIGQRRP